MHLSGVLDRLFTYARGLPLSQRHLDWLSAEGHPNSVTTRELVNRFNEQVHKAIKQLQATAVTTLYETRGVGRKQIPSTVCGLLFHAAEHTMRHLGQLLVTVNVLKAGYGQVST